MLSAPHTEVHPPVLDLDDDDDDYEDRPLLLVRASISELDNSSIDTSILIQEEDATDNAVADAIFRCALGVARARGEKTSDALRRRMFNHVRVVAGRSPDRGT